MAHYFKRMPNVNYCNIGTSFPYYSNTSPQIMPNASVMTRSAMMINKLYEYWHGLKSKADFAKDASQPLTKDQIKEYIFVPKSFFASYGSGGDFSKAPWVFMFSPSAMKDYQKKIYSYCTKEESKTNICQQYAIAAGMIIPGNDPNWVIGLHGANSTLTNDREYVTPIDLLMYVRSDVSKSEMSSMFDDICDVVESTDQYTKLDHDFETKQALMAFLYYFKKENDEKRADRVFDLAQGAYKRKSLAFLKNVKPFMAKKKGASINESKPIDDVISTESALVMYWYAKYMMGKNNGKIPSFYTYESMRQSFAGSMLCEFERGLLSDSLYSELNDFFNEKMLQKELTRTRNLRTYLYLLGYASNFYDAGDLIDYMSQNLDSFSELAKNFAKTAHPVYSYAGIGNVFQSKYDNFSLIINLTNSDPKKTLKFIITYINCHHSSEKELRIILDSYMSGRISYETRNDTGGRYDGDNTRGRSDYGKNDFLQESAPFVSEWTQNKILKYVLE